MAGTDCGNEIIMVVEGGIGPSDAKVRGTLGGS